MVKKYYLLLIMLGTGQIKSIDIDLQVQEYVIMPLKQLRKIVKPDELIIYSDQNKRGIVVDKNIWQLSTTLENIKESESNNEIKLESFTSTAIKYFFDMLRICFPDYNEEMLRKYIDQLSLARLIGVINMHMFLAVENHNKKIATILCDKLLQITNDWQKIKSDTSESLNQLNSDFTQEYIFPQIINRLNQQSLEKRNLYIANNKFVRSVKFSPDGSKIVSGSVGPQGNLMVWDVATGTRLYNLVGHQGMVGSVTFSPDGSKIASGSEGGQDNLMVWDVATGTRLYNLAGHHNSVFSVAFSPDGSKIVSGGGGNQDNLMIWDVATGAQLYNLVGHQRTVFSVAFSPDASKIVSGSLGNQDNLMVWDVVTGTRLYNLVGHHNSVVSVVFSPDGSKIVSGGGGNQDNLMIWDVATGIRLYNLVGHQRTVMSVAVSPDGSKIVSGNVGPQDNLMVWDVATGTRLYNLVGHQGRVGSVTFSPDGSKIVSGSEGGQDNLMVWDVATGTRLYNLAGHHNSVMSVAYSPDSSKIVSGGHKSMISNSFSRQELDYLKQCNATQILFLYRLCLSKNVRSKQKLDVSDQKIFNSLPYATQTLFMDLDLVEQTWRYWLINRQWKNILSDIYKRSNSRASSK